MAETYQEYRKRVLAYLGDRDAMRVLRSTPVRLKRLVDKAPRGVLNKRPAPGKWSIVEILAHLADAELAMGWRFRNMLATPGVKLAWWDEHLWSEKCKYSTTQPRSSLAVFQTLRKSNLALLQSVPQAAWRSAYGVHDKRGRQTVEDFIVMEAAHDLNHLLRIKQLIAAR